ncbi:MAG: hypothetical protein IPO86_05440 [Saprospiraceae bacterium]|nr:hypothetical protein [Saprospiraceae bacterium]MBK9727544.1 hypothetical protein [Saprospiraceae bacterium]
MRSLFYFLILTTIIVYSCLPEDKQVPSDFVVDANLKGSEKYLHDQAAEILFDSCCQCQLKVVRIHDCNNCADTLIWFLRSNGFSPNVYVSNSTVVFNTWGDTICIPHTAAIKTLCFYSRYGYNHYGETFIDCVLRCKQADDINWNTRNIRIASSFGLDTCSIDSTSAWGCRNIKNDSICGFLLPEQNDNFLDYPCDVSACCLDEL